MWINLCQSTEWKIFQKVEPKSNSWQTNPSRHSDVFGFEFKFKFFGSFDKTTTTFVSLCVRVSESVSVYYVLVAQIQTRAPVHTFRTSISLPENNGSKKWNFENRILNKTISLAGCSHEDHRIGNKTNNQRVEFRKRHPFEIDKILKFLYLLYPNGIEQCESEGAADHLFRSTKK